MASLEKHQKVMRDLVFSYVEDKLSAKEVKGWINEKLERINEAKEKKPPTAAATLDDEDDDTSVTITVEGNKIPIPPNDDKVTKNPSSKTPSSGGIVSSSLSIGGGRESLFGPARLSDVKKGADAAGATEAAGKAAGKVDPILQNIKQVDVVEEVHRRLSFILPGEESDFGPLRPHVLMHVTAVPESLGRLGRICAMLEHVEGATRAECRKMAEIVDQAKEKVEANWAAGRGNDRSGAGDKLDKEPCQGRQGADTNATGASRLRDPNPEASHKRKAGSVEEKAGKKAKPAAKRHEEKKKNRKEDEDDVEDEVQFLETRKRTHHGATKQNHRQKTKENDPPARKTAKTGPDAAKPKKQRKKPTRSAPGETDETS